MGGGGKGGDGGAAAARTDEQARQQRIREGTERINSIFNGTFRGGTLATAFDPNASYYNADGSAYTVPTRLVTETVPADYSPVSSSSKPGTSFGRREPDYAAVQQAIARGQLYSSLNPVRRGFDDDFYAGRRQAYLDYATPQLDEQHQKALRELTFSLDRSGLGNSSVRGQKLGELQTAYDTGRRAVSDTALNYENSARNSVESARSNLIGMLNATSDTQGAVNSALNQATILSAPEGYSPLGQMFGTFLSALGQQATNERTAALLGTKPYYNTGLFTPSSSSVKVTR